MDEFYHYRRDRNRHGGGVAIYVKETLATRRRTDIETGEAECCWIQCISQSVSGLIAVY